METMNTDTPETNAAKRPSGLRACADGLDVNPDKDFAQKCMRHAADRMEQLERERDEARDQLDQIILRLGETQECLIDAERQRDRLAEALNAILNDDPDSPLYKIKEARAALAAWKEARSESALP
jgi:hypothetical protein